MSFCICGGVPFGAAEAPLPRGVTEDRVGKTLRFASLLLPGTQMYCIVSAHRRPQPPNCDRTMTAIASPLVRSIASHTAMTPDQRARNFRDKPRKLVHELSLAAFAFRNARAHRDLGFSSLRDYIRARPGLTWNTWSGLVRVGTVLSASAQTSIQFMRGNLQASVIERMASQSDPTRWDELSHELAGLTTREAFDRLKRERRPKDRPSDHICEETVRVSISMPPAVANYIEDTLDLARSLLGEDSTEEQCIEAICAEVASDAFTGGASVHPLTARDRYAANLSAVRKRPQQSPAEPSRTEPDESPSRPAPRELDAQLIQLVRQREALEIEREDELLTMFHQDVHGQHGYPRFKTFAEECLELPERTADLMLQRARSRVTRHPLALARAQGRLTAVQCDQLRRLERHAGVPRVAMDAWIEEARLVTTRFLATKVDWAIRVCRTDLAKFARTGYAPPTDAAAQTSIQSPTSLAANPELPDLELQPEDFDPAASTAPSHTVSLRWTLSLDLADTLLELMASITDRARFISSRRSGVSIEEIPEPPPWWSLLKLCKMARTTWAQHLDLSFDRRWHRDTLERDRYRCRAPECTKRSMLEVHHIIFASHGGPDELPNLVTLCHYHHHRGVHEHRMAVSGRALRGAMDLRWRMGVMGEWIGDRRKPLPPSASAPSTSLVECADPSSLAAGEPS